MGTRPKLLTTKAFARADKAPEQRHEWHLLEPTAVIADEENGFPWGIPARCFSLDDQTDIAIVERLCQSEMCEKDR